MEVSATMRTTELCEDAPKHRGLALVQRGIGPKLTTHYFSAWRNYISESLGGGDSGTQARNGWKYHRKVPIGLQVTRLSSNDAKNSLRSFKTGGLPLPNTGKNYVKLMETHLAC